MMNTFSWQVLNCTPLGCQLEKHDCLHVDGLTVLAGIFGMAEGV